MGVLLLDVVDLIVGDMLAVADCNRGDSRLTGEMGVESSSSSRSLGSGESSSLLDSV